MEAKRQDRLGELFEEALALPAIERTAWLDGLRRVDPDLRADLLSLLESYREAPDFLEGVPERIVGRAIAGLAGASAERSAPERIGERYEILERLGGGMGVVYKARDLRLGRLVALKFLPRYLSADKAARARLFAEAKAASVLDHPNIAVVHEIDETPEGRLFISMAFHEGETLREKLERGPLPVGEAVDVARQIASALSTAHRARIVHRDIKPPNVIVTTDGIVKVVDFGIAKTAGVDLTKEGVVLGTVAYMSPEQTRGEVTDPRTDLWSLGAVLHEMLTGVRPFRADSTEAVIHAIRHDEPEPVRRLRPETPSGLERVVGKCLAKDPVDRYEDAEALLADLVGAGRIPEIPGGHAPTRRRLVSGSVIALFLAVLGGFLGDRERSHGPGGDPTAEMAAGKADRVAVLPLVDDGSDPENAYFADALTEELIARIAKLSDLRVIASSSMMRYKGSDRRPQEIGRELEAAAVLMGRVRKAGDRFHIELRLVESRSGEALWAGDFDAGMEDILPVQREIAERVAEALQIRVPPGDRVLLAGEGTGSTQAYESFMKGRYFLGKWDEASARSALSFFRRALDADPTYARAWCGLADTYHVLARLLVLPADEAYPRVRGAAERALALDRDLAEGHGAMALAYSYYYWDPTVAEEHFRRAIDLDPDNPVVRAAYAEHLRNQGRFDEALVQVRAAQELDPLSSSHELEEGIIYYLSRRFDRAMDQYRRLLNADPEYRVAHFFIAKTHIQEGRYETALQSLQEVDPSGMSPGVRSLRGYIYAVTGRTVEAREMLASLAASSADPGVSPYHSAVIHIGLNETDQALEFLWEAYRERAWLLRLLKVDPEFDPVRSDPRFGALLREVGLESS